MAETSGMDTLQASRHNRRFSRASLLLRLHGILVTDLAHELGVSRRTVSAWACGRNPAPPRFFAAIAARGGPDLVAEIKAAIVEAIRENARHLLREGFDD